MPSSPRELQPADAPAEAGDAVVLLVDDWPATFVVPEDAADRLGAGPRWLVPAGGVLGLVLAALVLRGPTASPTAVWLLGALVVMVCGAVQRLGLGGPRGTTAAVAGATAAWVLLAAAVLTQVGLDPRPAAVLLVVGVVGQVLAVEHTRSRLRRHRDAVLAARGGTRSEGWVVAASGPPWDRALRIEPTGGGGGPWTAVHTDWRAVRPGVGHPVSIWRGESRGPAVVLLPRSVG